MKIVMGISGASGAIYAKRILDVLAKGSHQLAIVMSEIAERIWHEELDGVNIRQYDYPIYGNKDFDAPFASGSSVWEALVIIPCSMGLLGRIAHGTSEELLARAAEVFLKERRKLILVPRETPYHLMHLENMRLLTLAGATILPASPSFYSRPKTLEEAVDTVVARVLDHLGIENQLRRRWGS